MNAGRPRRRPQFWPAAALTLVMFGAGACAVPLDEKAHITAPEDVPYQLLEKDPGPESPTVPVESALESFDAYFVRNGALVAVPTLIPSPAGPTEVLGALLEGPDADNLTRGLRSALTDASLVLSTRFSGGVVTIDLAAEFSDLASREQLLALAQMVMTMTSLRGVGLVNFEVDSKATEIPIADGTLTDRPVSRDSYKQLLNGATDTSTTTSSTTTSSTTNPSTAALSPTALRSTTTR